MSFLRNLFFKGSSQRHETSETLVIILEEQVYERLRSQAVSTGKTEDEVLFEALERGMATFNAHQVKDQQDDYELTKVLFEQSKHDHELLEAIVRQNEELRKILSAALGTRSESGKLS